MTVSTDTADVQVQGHTDKNVLSATMHPSRQGAVHQRMPKETRASFSAAHIRVSSPHFQHTSLSYLDCRTLTLCDKWSLILCIIYISVRSGLGSREPRTLDTCVLTVATESQGTAAGGITNTLEATDNKDSDRHRWLEVELIDLIDTREAPDEMDGKVVRTPQVEVVICSNVVSLLRWSSAVVEHVFCTSNRCR